MDKGKKRCQHISGDPQQPTHTLPCRDELCFSCLKQIPGLLTGEIFSCPFCGGYSQYVDPKRTVLGAQETESPAAKARVENNVPSLEGTTPYSSSEMDERIHEKGEYNTVQNVGSRTSSYATSSDFGHKTSWPKNSPCVNQPMDIHGSEKFPAHDEVTENMSQFELEEQRKRLIQFNEEKKHRDAMMTCSENNPRQPYTSNSGLERNESQHREQDLYPRQNSPRTIPNNDRTDYFGSTNACVDSHPLEHDDMVRSRATDIQPPDYRAPPDEVVGNISQDELQNQKELMTQFNQKQQGKDVCQGEITDRQQAIYDNVPLKDYAGYAKVDKGRPKSISCERHDSKPFVMICPTCNIMLCKECLDINPHKHTFYKESAISVKYAKEKLLESFEKSSRTLSAVHETIDKESTRMDGDAAEILRKTEEIKQQIERETGIACEKLRRNAEAMTKQVDAKFSQLFASRESHGAKVNAVKEKLDTATAIIRNKDEMIETNNIPLARLAEESVANLILDIKKMILRPPTDNFDLVLRTSEIPDSTRGNAPVRVDKESWSRSSYSSSWPIYF